MASRYEQRCSSKIKLHWEKNLSSADALTLRRLVCGMKQRAVEDPHFWTRDRKWLYDKAQWRLEQLRSIGLGGRGRESGWNAIKEMEKQAASADQRAKLNAQWQAIKDEEVKHRPVPHWHQEWARHQEEIQKKYGCPLRRDISNSDWV